MTPTCEHSVKMQFVGCTLRPVRAEEQVIESLIGCTNDARFIVRTFQFRLDYPTPI